jgi:glycine cleavage system H protein
MNMSTISRPRIHFTKDHEWIDFNGTVGFIGLSAFKLAGIKKIDSVKWFNNKGSIEKGTLIANLYSGDEIIPVNAPVKCKFLGPNIRLNNNLDLILESPQDRGWIFFITPSKFQDREGLLQPEDYQKLIRVPVAL